MFVPSDGFEYPLFVLFSGRDSSEKSKIPKIGKIIKKKFDFLLRKYLRIL